MYTRQGFGNFFPKNGARFSDREAQKPCIFVSDRQFYGEARVQNDHWASCTLSEFALLVFFSKP
ncbi:hypothetical protein CKA32_001232 [Geitlerinema sp. FC II]|nr:hypothetical protein CKA32_001232 [Geitlerinema sp. FC II]